MPEPIVTKLDQAIGKAMKDPGVLQTLEQFVLTPVYRDHEEFRKLVLRDFDRERDLIKELGLGKPQ
jgi:tripartite-type tricarboxylate transporter receptor subunit TctC